MILEMVDEDYSSLLLGRAPRGLKLADTSIASIEVLEMLAAVAAKVREQFSPASWLIVENGEVAGLCSVIRSPAGGLLEIGYGIAPSRRGRGIAGRAVGEVVAWARAKPGLVAVTAETNFVNVASQKVLSRNGFGKVGTRVDDEDGPLICWRCPTD